jgi:NADH-quinone oxidoreductase subunit A
LIYIGGPYAFWIFTLIEVLFLIVAIIIAKLLGPKKPTKIKKTIYECGQEPFGEAREFRISGITRYFGYAVVFFALDAFAWVLLTAALSINTIPHVIGITSTYLIVVLVGVGYFLNEQKKLVK